MTILGQFAIAARARLEKANAERRMLEWPLDAPQSGAAPRRELKLAVAKTLPFGAVNLLLTIDGQSESFYLEGRVAASMIAELARALANSP